MPDPFLGEIRLFALSFAPVDWVPCDGRVMPIAQNQALYSLLGTQFGGDGKQTFNLPDMRGRVGVSQNSSTGGDYPVGKMGGAEAVTLTASTVPGHSHSVMAVDAIGTSPIGIGNYLAKPVMSALITTPLKLYAPAGSASVALNPSVVTAAGGGEPHANLQPYLTQMYAICVSNGTYPPHPN